MNDKNLKPINERADFIEISRKGGRNSGISRRKKAEKRKIFDILMEIISDDLTANKARANRGKSRNAKPQESTSKALKNAKNREGKT